MSAKPAKKPHHHGELRAALIAAGLELLANNGPDGVSLRKCAAMAGVSHAAPAHHFNGLISLKVAVMAQGHAIFAEFMCRARDRADATPQARLLGICEGYIEFAQTHPALFGFMFQSHGDLPESIDATTRAEYQTNAFNSYDVLHRACVPFEHSGDNALVTETLVWSLVHGYAMLFRDRDTRRMKARTVPPFAEILPVFTLRDAAN